jgi:hypothetical protein
LGRDFREEKKAMSRSGLGPIVTGLSVLPLPRCVQLWPRAQCAGAERTWRQTVALFLPNNLAASCGAFVLGIAAR